MSSKKNISLIIGIAIPIFMIFLIIVSIYLPSLFAPAPRFDFLYVTGDNCCQYVVENGKLTTREVEHPEYCTGVIRLFVYDVSTDEDRKVSFEEAQKLKLDDSVKSPDGYEVVYGEYGLFSLFFPDSRDYNAMYLRGHNACKKLNPRFLSKGRYYRNCRFLGWIIR